MEPYNSFASPDYPTVPPGAGGDTFVGTGYNSSFDLKGKADTTRYIPTTLEYQRKSLLPNVSIYRAPLCQREGLLGEGDQNSHTSPDFSPSSSYSSAVGDVVSGMAAPGAGVCGAPCAVKCSPIIPGYNPATMSSPSYGVSVSRTGNPGDVILGVAAGLSYPMFNPAPYSPSSPAGNPD